MVGNGRYGDGVGKVRVREVDIEGFVRTAPARGDKDDIAEEIFF